LTKRSSRVGPRELNDAMVSSLRRSVRSVSAAPTVIAPCAFAGDVMLPYTVCPSEFLPLLPADTATTMPRRVSCSTICTSGSVAADS
jgi:hypothetical protein